MKKKFIIGFGILIVIIIIAIVGVYIFVSKEKHSQDSTPQPSTEATYGTDLNEDLMAKAMIYVANEYNYTTENYLIDISLQNDTYAISVNTKDNALVQQITIGSEELKKWEPDNASPEEVENVDTSQATSVPES